MTDAPPPVIPEYMRATAREIRLKMIRVSSDIAAGSRLSTIEDIDTVLENAITDIAAIRHLLETLE